MKFNGFEMIDEAGETLVKCDNAVTLIKAHVKGYTRKDGTFVSEHDDKRPAADWRDEENWHSRQIAKMKTHSEAELRYIAKDAAEAARASESMGNHEKAGKYWDEMHYASMELKKRQTPEPSSSPFLAEHENRLRDEVMRWANKEHGQYGTEWIRKHAPKYLHDAYGVDIKHADEAISKWFA